MRSFHYKTFSVVLTILVFYFFIGKSNTFSADNDQKIFYTLLKGTINKKLASNFKGVLQEAENKQAVAFIIEIDTFGGRLDSAVEIKDQLIDTKINSIVFINKKAISAGALISLAAKHIVIAPGSTIGAATPIRLTYWKEEPVSEKVISYFRKEMKSTAEANNYPGNIAEAMVDPSFKIEGLVEKGKLLTLTTKEALRFKVAEFEAKDLDELLKHFKLQGIEVVKRPIPWTDKVVNLTSSDTFTINLTLVWFLIGLVLVFLEFAVPGVILIFFGVGAWIVTTATYFELTTSLASQLLLFSAASIILLVSLRKWIKGKFYGYVSDEQDPTKNLDEFTGKSVLVLKDIIPGKMEGAVEFKGATWNAMSEEHIKHGEVAIIIDVDGINLKVQKKKEG